MALDRDPIAKELMAQLERPSPQRMAMADTSLVGHHAKGGLIKIPRFALGGFVGGLNPGLSHQPSTGALQAALTSNIGMGGGYMAAKMQTQSTQSYAVDLRTDHGTYTVLATEDQMGSMLQG